MIIKINIEKIKNEKTFGFKIVSFKLARNKEGKF